MLSWPLPCQHSFITLLFYYFIILFITSINGIIVIGCQANQFPKIDMDICEVLLRRFKYTESNTL